MTHGSNRSSHAWRRLAELRRGWRDPALTILAALLAAQMFVIHPLDVVAHSPLLAIPLFSPLLLVAVVVVADNLVAVLIVLAGIGVTTAATVVQLRGAADASLLLHLIGGLVVTVALFWVAAAAVFAPGRITYHRIVGTFLLYLIIGATFSGIYGIVDILAPHAFRGIAGAGHPGALIDQALYFSFSTLTTAGFGDITPADAVTRGLANLEAVIGQLFPPTVIAWMMTLRLADHIDRAT